MNRERFPLRRHDAPRQSPARSPAAGVMVAILVVAGCGDPNPPARSDSSAGGDSPVAVDPEQNRNTPESPASSDAARRSPDKTPNAATTTPPSAALTTPAGTQPSPPPRSTEVFAQATAMAAAGDVDSAVATLRRWIVANPDDAEAIFRLSTSLASQGDLLSAIELLDGIDRTHPAVGLPALGQSADYAMQAGQFDDAVARYELLLEIAPEATVAIRRLAYLYNRLGRRYPAANLARELCRRGDVREDELLSLISVPDAMFDPPQRAEEINVAAGDRHYVPIGPTGEARRLYGDNQLDAAAALLRDYLTTHPQSPADVWAFCGRVIAESLDDANWRWWIDHRPTELDDQPEYWAALGARLIDQKQFSGAIDCLWRAYSREPSDMASARRLRQAFLSMAETDSIRPESLSGSDARAAAESFGDRFKALNFLKTSGPGDRPRRYARRR